MSSIFDKFAETFSNPVVGTTIFENIAEGEVIKQKQKLAKEKAEADRKKFIEEQEIRQKYQVETFKQKEEYKQSPEFVEAEAKKKADIDSSSSLLIEQNKNEKSLSRPWSKDGLVSLNDITNFNKVNDSILENIEFLGDVKNQNNEVIWSPKDGTDALMSIVNSGTVSQASLLKNIEDTKINAEIEKQEKIKLLPTFKESQEQKELLARQKSIKQEFTAKDMAEADRIISAIDKNKLVVDMPAKVFENQSVLDDYNNINTVKLNRDSNSFISFSTTLDTDYNNAPDSNKASFAEQQVLQYTTLTDGVFDIIDKENKPMADKIRQQLASSLFRVYDQNQTFIEKEGEKIADPNFAFAWDKLIPDIDNTPNWFKEVLNEEMNLRLSTDQKQHLTSVTNTYYDPETNTLNSIQEYKRFNVTEQDINDNFPVSVYNSIEGKNAPTLEEYKIIGIMAHHNVTGNPLHLYGVAYDDKKSAYVLLENVSPEQLEFRKTAYTNVTGASRIPLYGAKIVSPLFYDYTGKKYDLDRSSELYDDGRLELLSLLAGTGLARPTSDMRDKVLYDPVQFFDFFVNAFAAGIKKDGYGNWLLPFNAPEDKTSFLNRQGKPARYNQNIRVKNAQQYADFLGINIKALNETVAQETKALDQAEAMHASLEKTGVGSSLIEQGYLFFNAIKTATGLNFNLSTKDYNHIEGDEAILRTIENLNIEDEELKSIVMKSLSNQETIELKKNQKDINLLTKMGEVFSGSTAEQIANQQMLHASLVFYAAAAFQGEGGKAISDADREFVAWALGYGVFSTAETRQSAVRGLIAIMAKSRAINEGLTSNSIPKMWAAKNFDRLVGRNVDRFGRGHALDPDMYPKEIRDKYFMDDDTSLYVKNLDPNIKEKIGKVPVKGTTNKETGNGQNVNVGSRTLNFVTDTEDPKYKEDRIRAEKLYNQSRLNRRFDIMNELNKLYPDIGGNK